MNSSPSEQSRLEDSIKAVTSLPSTSTEDASDFPPSNDSPPQPPPVQRIGKFSIPCQGWSLLRLDPPNEIILHVGAEQLRVVAAGQWEPPEPDKFLPNNGDLPHPLQNESHMAFALRYFQWMQPAKLNPEWLRWTERKVWIGQTVDQLRDLIESEVSIPNDCSLIIH